MTFFRKKPVSIRLGIFVCYSILLLFIAAAVCFSALYMTQKAIIMETGNSRIDVLSQISARAKLIKSSMTTLSNLLYRDEWINGAVFGDPGVQEELRIQENAQKYESAYKELDFGIYSVLSGENGFGFCSDTTRLYDFERIRKCLWYKNVAAGRGEICWVSSYDDTYLKGNGNYVFSAARVFNGEDGAAGVLLVSVPERILFDTYKIALNGNNSIYIVDKSGTIVSHDNPGMIGLNYFNMDVFHQLVETNNFSIITKVKDKYLLSNVYDERTGWTIVEEIPLDSLMAPMHRLSTTVVGITLFCLILAFALAYVLARLTVNPIRTLCARMERVKDGDMEVWDICSGWTETRQLGESFNQMIGDIKMLMRQLKDKEKKKRMAELDFLQMQINPHFLYNTLFTIKCMVEMGKGEEAVKMMDIFIPLLKEGISSSQEMVYIRDECHWLRRFVQLIQYRYEEPIDVDFDISAAASGCYIPRMLLQPIVENSIYHGIENMKGAHIQVTACVHNNRVTIRITDNGRGIDPETLRTIEAGQWKKNSFNKVGLLNVRERIQIIFGGEYGLHVDSVPGEGTVVTVTIPEIN